MNTLVTKRPFLHLGTLVTKRPFLHLGPQFVPQNYFFRSSSITPKYPKFFPRTRIQCSSNTVSGAVSADSFGYYGGWDHPNLDYASEYNQLRTFLLSVGIGDKKYLFVYLLGFVCALAISRIKVSSILLFPACVVVFGVGFSVGFFNGGRVSSIGAKKIPKGENFKELGEKIGSLIGLLSGCNVNIESLKSGIKKGIDCNEISLSDLRSLFKTAESIDSANVNAKSVVEECMKSIILAENQDIERNSYQNSSKRKKAGVEKEFNFSQFFANLFQERSASSKPAKLKDLPKRESAHVEVDHRDQANALAPSVEESTSRPSSNKNVEGGTSGIRARNRYGGENMINGAQRVKAVLDKENLKYAEANGAVEASVKSRKYTYQRRSLEYTSKREVSRWESQEDGLLDSLDLRMSSLQHQKTEVEFGQEEKREKLEGEVKGYESGENDENEVYGYFVREEGAIPNWESSSVNGESTEASEDMEFSRYLVEANSLLKSAKECLLQKGDEEVAENFLLESSELLLKAKSIRPMSLLAAGLLGNTYLLHGELKLRLSRDLRALIATDSGAVNDEWNVEDDDLMSRKGKLSSLLVNVCDECEELLVSAGRNYRLALSIDGHDMKALYNWGLALFFRAQLIADIGPGAARDADKVYLAAIDKFDAMMSKSNTYAPNALFRWGAALQQRSRLRPRNSREKVKLLQQARRLYEDALDFDSDNTRVREALSSCVSELKYWYD